MWLLFLGLHLAGIVGYNLTLRKLLTEKDRLDSWQLATVLQVGISIPMVCILPIVLPDLGHYTWQDVFSIVVISLLIASLHISNVKSLQYLEAGVYAVFYNLRIIFTTFLGIFFLHESIVPLRILGGLLIFLAVFIVRQKGRKDLTLRGVWWGVTAATVISVLNIFEKAFISRVGFIRYAVPVMLLTLVLMLTISVVRKQTVPLAVFRQPRMLQLMGLRAVSAFCFALALSVGGLVSVSNYISSLSVIILVILGILLLGERDYLKRKILAASLALAGLTVILIANNL